jgi:hypothetical protein
MGRAQLAAMDLDTVHRSFRTLVVFGHRGADFGNRSLSLASEEREGFELADRLSFYCAPAPDSTSRDCAAARPWFRVILPTLPDSDAAAEPLNGPNPEEGRRAFDRRQALTAGQPEDRRDE